MLWGGEIMIFEIKTVRNGCTVTIRPSDEGDHWAFEGDDSATFVVQEGYVDEFEAWRALLLELLETYGPAESRSAEKRLYVTVAPGNRHPSFVDTLYYDYEHPPNQDDQGVDWDGSLCLSAPAAGASQGRARSAGRRRELRRGLKCHRCQ